MSAGLHSRLDVHLPLLNQARYLPLTPPARNIRKVLQMKYLPNRPAEVFVDEEVVE